MSTAVVAYDAAPLQDRVAYANTLAAAGDLIPRGLRDPQTGKPSAPKILLVMETGSMLGLHPMASLQTIDVVEGRAALSAKLQKALITKAGHKVEIIKTGSIPGGDYSVTVNATRADNGDFHSSTWDIPRAIRAGSVDSYKPNAQGVWEVRARSTKGAAKPWEAYAESLPVWRAISDIGREGFGDVLFGLYSTEELRDGMPVDDRPKSTEPTKDWAALIDAAATKEDLDALKIELRETGEGTDDLRTQWLTRSGEMDRESDIVDAEVVDEDASDNHDYDETVDDEDEAEIAPHAIVSDTPDLVNEMSEEDYERISAEEFAREQAEREADDA